MSNDATHEPVKLDIDAKDIAHQFDILSDLFGHLERLQRKVNGLMTLLLVIGAFEVLRYIRIMAVLDHLVNIAGSQYGSLESILGSLEAITDILKAGR